MDEIQMLDAVERYIRDEMNQQEKEYFEQLRNSNPEVDQLVVAHTMFLNQLNKFGEHKNFKAGLNEVHTNLVESGEIIERVPKPKVVEFFRRNKKVWAVAASIAGITAIAIAGMMSYYTQKKSNEQLQTLGRKFSNEVIKAKNEVRKELNNLIISKAPENVEVKSGGTGFLIDGNGYLVTNAHVVNNASSVIVQNNKQQEFRAKTLFIDKLADIAILKIVDEDFKSFSSIPYAIRKNGADLGEQLFTLGYPRDEIVYNEGYMSAKTGFGGDTMSCQIGVAANPGNSGGPVFNKNGEVIGIINTRQTQAQGVVFAVTAKNLFRTFEEAKKDTVFQNVKLPVTSTLKGMDRTQQIKKIEDCIFMVKSY